MCLWDWPRLHGNVLPLRHGRHGFRFFVAQFGYSQTLSRASLCNMLQFLALKALREVALVLIIPCCLRTVDDTQHVQHAHIPAIPLVYNDFYMGNLSPI